MRLSEEHRLAILRVVAETCGPQARVRLFGSRVDDAWRGGDVDWLVEQPCDPDDVNALQRHLDCRTRSRTNCFLPTSLSQPSRPGPSSKCSTAPNGWG